MAIRVGCGSWSDKEYVPLLDPDRAYRQAPLTAYARVFDYAEVNSSYYAVPKPAAIRQWIAQTPPGFLFDLKLHRVLSMAPARAAAAQEGAPDLVRRTLDAVEPLVRAKKFGVFLLVLAPHFRPGKHALDELDALAERLRPHLLAVELRDRGWITGAQRRRTLDYFRARKLAWVTVDMPPLKDDALLPFIDEVTDPRLAYFRLHGRNRAWLEAGSAAERHHYAYPPVELRTLARRIGKAARHAKAVRVVANNHAEDFAPRTALALQKLFGLSKSGSGGR
jgi:uncharacterized protein YecE (DUF72 family)